MLWRRAMGMLQPEDLAAVAVDLDARGAPSGAVGYDMATQGLDEEKAKA
jgi:hypothetical protein